MLRALIWLARLAIAFLVFALFFFFEQGQLAVTAEGHTDPGPGAAFAVPTGPKDVFVVGDSLTVGVEPWLASDLVEQGWTLDGVDARVGRGVSEGLNRLQADAADLPDTVLVALGTNDLGATPAEVEGWLSNARDIVGGRRLIWVNLCLNDKGSSRLASYRQIDDALETFAPDYGVELADWCAFATRHDITPGYDGIHYGAAGYQQRAAFYTRVITGG